MDNIISNKANWYDAISDISQGILDSPFNEFGENNNKKMSSVGDLAENETNNYKTAKKSPKQAGNERMRRQRGLKGEGQKSHTVEENETTGVAKTSSNKSGGKSHKLVESKEGHESRALNVQRGPKGKKYE